MDDPRESHPQSISLSTAELEEIDRVCDAFELEWRTGQPPRLESFVPLIAASLQSRLFRALLGLEVDYHRRQGNVILVNDYTERFPEWQHIVHEVLGTDQLQATVEATQRDDSTQPSLAETAPHGSPTASRHLGRFEIRSILGEGSFGEVLRGYDPQLKREVAIKVARRGRAAGGPDVQLLEAQVAAGLDHPGIVPIYEVDRLADGRLFIVSKLIDGTDLRTRLKNVTYSVRESVQLIVSIAEALHAAHLRGVIHRDIKPGNILIDSQHRPYITDFGLALRLEQTGAGAEFVGTPAYMSPEQAREEGHLVDARSDVFSLTVVLFEMLTGQRPFQAATRKELLDKIRASSAAAPSVLNELVTPELDAIVIKGLARQAGDRYSTAEAFAQDLRAWMVAGTKRAEEARDVGLVIPKGLRAFDEHDAGFFLKLVPGPRNRSGLPESIAFWKTAIESREAMRTFRVGVVYGPSGIGKSSLIQAGLLPILDSCIRICRIAATPDRTAESWIRELHRQFPGLSRIDDLVQAMRELRGGRAKSREDKALIVLDPFEQWLSRNVDLNSSPVAMALRQCDGVHVQALLLVRDDYWYALSRLAQFLDVQLDTQNCRMVEACDEPHARRVLLDFGRGLGHCRAGSADELGEPALFVESVIRELTESGPVFPGQLALVAEMFRSRPWTRQELQRVGGVRGVFTQFLDEQFAERTGHPVLRQHAETAFQILRAMLPSAGSALKDQPRLASELQSRASIADAKTCREVLDVLERDIRILTVVQSDDDSAEDRAYQLTHDNLVPVLRDWVARRQRHTWRGRVESLLADRSDTWRAQRSARALPTFLEWCAIAGLSRRRSWTAPARAMMRAATGWYVRRMTAIAGILLACLILAGQAWRSSATKTLIERIKDADTPEVPAIIGQSDIPARHAARRLKSAIGQLERGAATGQEATRLARRLFNLRLAWAFYDESQLPTMLQKLGVTESTDAVPVVAPRDVAPVCQMLRQHKTSVVPSLWQAIDDAHSDSARRVLRRASVLAQLDPGSSNWKAVATQVASELVRSPPTQLSTWAELLLPVRHVLVEPLVGFFDTLDNLDEQRNLAEVFTLYAGDDLDRMTGMVRDARPLQLSAALEAVAQHSQRATLHLEKEFSRILKGPQPFDLEDIEDIPPALVNKFRDWSGAVGEKAAFALSIPIGEINKLQIQMGRAGYRPTTFRPYTRADGTDAAVGWRRDGAVSEVRYDLDSTGLNRSDALAEEQDMALTDLCVYRTGSSADSDRFAATWCTEATIGFPQHLSVDLSADAYVETLNEFRASGFAPVRMFARQTDDGEPLFTVLWRKERPNERSSTLPVAQLTHVFRNWYIGWLASDCQLSMIDLNRHDLYASQFYLARHRGGPDSSASKLFAMANHSMRVGKLEDSRSYAEQAFKMEPSNVDYAKLWIRTLCMNGQPSLARKAIDQLATEGFDDKQLTLLRVRVACADGDPSTAMELLASLDRLGTDNTSVWSPDHADAILAHALVADLVGKSDVAQADGYRKRARDLIAVVPDAETLATLSNDPDLDALRKDRSFRQLLETHGLGVRMFGMWRGANDLRSRMSFDMDSKALKAFCEKLLRAGHWPHAISCGYSVDLDQLVGSSIWYKPMPLPSDQIRRDSKLANLAIGLAQLKSTKRLIENLSDRHGRQTRTYVVERLPESGLPASMLMDIFHETNVELVRRNLLLALGGFDSGSMPTNQLDEFVHHLRETLPAHPHAGLRSAGLWCLKTWGRGMTEKSSQQHSRPRQANWSVNSLGKVMIELESPGRVLIGAPSWEEGLAGNEVQHYRIVPRRFALSDTEITVDEFDQFQRDPEINRLYATEGRFTFARDSAPEGACAQISLRFMDAVRFCQWLSQREGLPEDEWCYPGALDPEIHSYTAPADYLTRKGYRLPLEAEWEFACRAGSPLSRHYGESDDILSSYAWYDRNSQQRSHPVAILKPNEWGFFDMLGNVGEWAQDDYRLWHDEETPSRMTDLSTNRERTVRGGFYNTPATGLRSASRTPVQAGLNPRQIGMRVARTL